jgi:hypothetical protein
MVCCEGYIINNTTCLPCLASELPWLDGDGDGDGELQLSGGGSSALQKSSTADNSVNNNNALKHKLLHYTFTLYEHIATGFNITLI